MSETHASQAAMEVGARLTRDVLEPMKRTFVEKDEIVDLLGVCLVARENLFILGPPGTAKSALVLDLAKRLEGRAFDYLLTRFTEPNELFGPFDIRRLRDGDLVTNTEGMLPEADFVFLDELLNANSAILNSLLMVLNERVFRRGRETVPLPTTMVVGASNRLPEDDTLRALFDRFLLRVPCANVAPERMPDVLDRGWRLDLGLEPVTHTVHVDDVRRLHGLLPEVDLTAVLAPYLELVHRLRHAGIDISDRRAVKLQRLIAASALLCGRRHAVASDLWIMRYVWETEEQQQVIDSIVTDALDRAASAAAAAETTDDRTHPRARAARDPDPEAIARDLDAIEIRLDSGETPEHDRAYLQDRVSVLAARCEWIGDTERREHLGGIVRRLWTKLGVET